MKMRYLFALSVAAALLLPYAAQAQSCYQGACESWATYDPTSGAIYGGSYYENGIYDGNVFVQPFVCDPSGACTGVGYAVAYVYAECDFTGYEPDMTGTYTVVGYNYYQIEDGWWNPDGASSTTVYATAIPPTQDPTPSIQGYVPPAPWQAGTSFMASVYGAGFGTSPNLKVTGSDGTTWGSGGYCQQCDQSVGAWVTVPPNAPSGYATLIVTSNGYNGMGFLGPPGEPDDSST